LAQGEKQARSFALRFYLAAIVFAGLEDFAKYTWHLTGAALFIRDAIDAVFWTVALIISIIIAVKFLTRK
jgi:hypothetical protein